MPSSFAAWLRPSKLSCVTSSGHWHGAGVAGEQVPDTTEGHNPDYKHGVFLKSIKKHFNFKKKEKKKEP